MNQSPITSHVLDTSRGQPAQGITIIVERAERDGPWTEIARGVTDPDGRASTLLPVHTTLIPGMYRLRFGTGAYFLSQGIKGFYPEVQVIVQIEDPTGNYHIPLLLSPYGYSTYRGS
jgi:5-hydroxyisourate hydrolase